MKQYQYYIFSWSSKIWAPIFMHLRAVTNLKKGLYYSLAKLLMSNFSSDIFVWTILQL